MQPTVFISYRRGDCDYARQLRDLIATRSSVFLDEAIRPGDYFPETIARAISTHDVFLMLIGPSWLAQALRLRDTDDWVRSEFEQAQRERKRQIPIRVGVQTSAVLACLPPQMNSLRQINFADWGPDLAAAMGQIGVFYPVQLPEKPRVETSGRVGEMDWLDEKWSVAGSHTPLLNLYGPPGVGKSRLAMEYAFAFGKKQRYPGGLCWIDVKGKSADDEIVAFFGAHLGFEPEGTSNEQVSRGWKRWSLEYPGRKLIVFDNVERADQIEGLLPNHIDAVDVLVTSRQKLELPASASLRVLPVGDADALDMLRAYAKDANYALPDASDPDTQELCKMAGGLPLVIKLLGEYLGRHADDVRTLVHELRVRGIGDAIEDEGQMKILVDAVWEGLNTEGAQLASILSLFNAPPFTWSLAGGIRRNDRSEAARRISALDIASFHDGATTPIHSVLQSHFVQKLASEARETTQVWSILVDHFVFQQFIYDSQYLANALDTVRRVRCSLPRSNTTAHLVLDKLVAHACYGGNETARKESLDCFARLLAEPEPKGVNRWYAIFAADHAQNLLVTRFENKNVEGFAFTSAELERTVHRLLPPELLQTSESPKVESFPFLLRAAHFWGHQGNQRSFELYDRLETLKPDDFSTKEEEGRNFYYRAAIFRLGSLRFSSERIFKEHVTPLLKEIKAPTWLDSPVDTPRKWEFSVERFNSDAQGFGDTAHQIRGLGDVQIWAYLYWEISHHNGMSPSGLNPNERLAEAKHTLDLTRQMWDIAKKTARHGEKPIQYYLWLADLEEKIALATAHAEGRPIDDWETVQQRVAQRQRELEKEFGLRYEWARSKSIVQLKKFLTLISALRRRSN